MSALAIDPAAPAAVPGSDVASELGLGRRADGSVDAAQVAEKFEAVLTSMLLSEMRQAGDLRLFGDTPGSQVFEGIFDRMMGDALAARGGLGLSRDILESIERTERAQAALEPASAASPLPAPSAPAAPEV